MPAKRTSDTDNILAAVLLCEERRTQKQISEFLQVSPSVVSRLLKDAKKRNYFAKEYRINGDRVPAAQLKQVREKLARPELADKLRTWAARFGHRYPSVRIFPTPSAADKADRIVEFGTQIAPAVAEHMLRAKLCGVTWGRMIMGVMRALKASPTTKSGQHGVIDFIPLVGEPLGKEPTSSSSSTLAEELGQLFNGQQYHARSLTMVPALIPREFTILERAALQKFVEMQPNFQEIFGRMNQPRAESTLAKDLDCLITSVGNVPLGFSRGSLLHGGEREMFVGDIGGVLIPDRKIAARTRDDIKKRWTGLCEEDLVGCASRAAETGLIPGVVVISRGAERAPVLLAAIQRGLVNHIIIDTELALALSQSLSTGTD